MYFTSPDSFVVKPVAERYPKRSTLDFMVASDKSAPLGEVISVGIYYKERTRCEATRILGHNFNKTTVSGSKFECDFEGKKSPDFRDSGVPTLDCRVMDRTPPVPVSGTFRKRLCGGRHSTCGIIPLANYPQITWYFAHNWTYLH
jgi:hypothetical protein